MGVWALPNIMKVIPMPSPSTWLHFTSHHFTDIVTNHLSLFLFPLEVIHSNREIPPNSCIPCYSPFVYLMPPPRVCATVKFKHQRKIEPWPIRLKPSRFSSFCRWCTWNIHTTPQPIRPDFSLTNVKFHTNMSCVPPAWTTSIYV